MRRIISCALLLSLLAFCGCNSNPKTAPKRIGWDWDGLEYDKEIEMATDGNFHYSDNPPLYGDIKSVTITEFDAKMSNGGVLVKKRERNKLVYDFNQRGDVDKVTEYERYGLSNYSYYNYDADGSLLEILRYTRTGRLAFKISYKYNREENILEVLRDYRDDFGAEYGVLVDTYKYNKRGLLIEYSDDEPDAPPTYKSFQYDMRGRLSKMIGNECDFELSILYNYNWSGYKIEENGTSLSPDNSKWSWRRYYKRDFSGNLVEESHYANEGELSYYCKYDTKENAIEEVRYDSNGDIDSKYTYQYQYDLEGNIIEKVRYGRDGEQEYKYAYKYDAMGNLIEMVYYGKSSISVVEYKIVYRE